MSVIDPHSPADTQPAIVVLDPPDPMAVLREKLAAAEAERDKLSADNRKLGSDLSACRTSLEGVQAKVKALEENPLTFALANLDAGQVLMDAGDSLKHLCQVVQDRQEKGTLTVKLTVKPFQGTALVFVPDVKVSEPKQDPPQGVFFADDAGALTRHDPRQKEFGFSRRGED